MSEEYLTKTIAAYDRSPGKYESSTEAMILLPELEKILALMPDNGLPVLDAGCGFGRDSILMKKRGKDVVGIDMSKGLLTRARELYPDIPFHRMDVRKLGFEDRAFAGIWCNAVLLHLTDEGIVEALKEFHRVLSPNGALMISFKKGTGSQELMENFSSNDARFFNYQTLETTNALLEHAGFEVADSYYVNERKRFGEDKRDLDWVYSFAVRK